MGRDGRALERRFEAVVFDWDGTAVPDRAEDASELCAVVERLCAVGVYLAVVTGTYLENIDGQLRARPATPGCLVLALNRGSEVFVVDETGPHLKHRRRATPDEDAALDAAAELTVRRLAERRAERRDRLAAPESQEDRPHPAPGVVRTAEGPHRGAGPRGEGAPLRCGAQRPGGSGRDRDGGGARSGIGRSAGDQRRQARGDRSHRQVRLGTLDLRRLVGAGGGPEPRADVR